MPFNVEAAKQSGYSEPEIIEYLASKQSFDVGGAKKHGYSDSEILGYLAGKNGVSTPKATLNSNVNQQVNYVGQSINGAKDILRGAGQLPAFALDMANVPLDYAREAVGVKPTGNVGTQFLNELLPRQENQTPGGRIQSRALEEIGAAAVPMAGILKAGQKVGQISNAIVKNITELARTNPAKFTAVETALATGGGAGAGFARENADSMGVSEDVADIIGTLIGSFGLSGAMDVVGGIKRSITGKWREWVPPKGAAAKERVGQQLLEHTSDSPRIIDNTIKAGELKEAIPGFKPTTAQTRGDEGLISLEKSVVSTSPGAKNRAGEVMVDNQIAIQNKLKGMQAKEVRDPIEALKKLGRFSNKEAGEIIGSEIKKGKSAARGEAEKLFDPSNLDPDSVIRFDMSGIKAEARRLSKLQRKADRGTDIPEIAKELTGKKFDDIETFGELKGLRERVSADLRDSRQGVNPNTKKVKKLHLLMNAIDNAMDNPIGNPNFQDVLDKYGEARKFYKENYIEKFKHGTVGKILIKGPRGEEFKLPMEQIPKQFIEGGESGVQDFVKAIAGGPQGKATKALHGAAINDLLDASVSPNTGEIVVSKFKNWMNNHKDLMKALPSLEERAKISLRKAFYDEMTAKSTNKATGTYDIPVLNGHSLKGYLTRNKATLKELYSEDEIKDLWQIQEALDLMGRSTKSTLTKGSDTTEKLAGAIGRMWSRAFGVARGVIGVPFVLAERGTRAAVKAITDQSAKEVKALLEEAIFDPEVAETLIMTTRKGMNPKIIRRRVRAHLVNLGPPKQEENKPKRINGPGNSQWLHGLKKNEK